jgi:hypothetical protein
MFGTLALPILDVIGKVLDKLIPDADAREKAKAEIMSELARNDAALTQAARDTIVAEAQGESWAQRNWRPMLMFTIMGLLVWTGVVLPLLSAATRIDFVALQAWSKIPFEMWSLLQLGVGGYLVGRTGEKMIDTWAAMKGGAR